MPGPISPNDVQLWKNASIPEEVFEVFNQMIAEHWDGSEALLLQNSVLVAVAVRLCTTTQYVLEKKWLDVEDAYRKAGWHVKYDKPGYNEGGPASFSFRKTAGTRP